MNIKSKLCNLRLQRYNDTSNKENSKGKQDDPVSKLVTAVESLSSQLTSLKQDFQDLKQRKKK